MSWVARHHLPYGRDRVKRTARAITKATKRLMKGIPVPKRNSIGLMGSDNRGSSVLSKGCCSSELRATFIMLDYVSCVDCEILRVLTHDLSRV